MEKLTVDPNRIHLVAECVFDALRGKEFELAELLLGLDEVISNIFLTAVEAEKTTK
ncbi:MAG: hypothetical protein HY376_02070 [Candidatus Blackburnbacteria bacterium]|nr:hypothetical protein [Candidatus Blackburnbacteria bacterium]